MGIDLFRILTSAGPFVAYLIVFVIVFAESGLLVGFLLPGDSLLLTVGILASHRYLDLTVLIPIIFVGAVLGDNVGYRFGRHVGPAIFDRPGSRFFRRDLLQKAKAFYDRHGAVSIAVARFLPYIRTFAPIVAGVVKMEYRVFILFNVLGAALWSVLITLAGFLIGYLFGQIPGFDRYFDLLLVVGALITALFVLLHIWKENHREISAWFGTRTGTGAAKPGRGN